METRVVVTGMGIVSPLGETLDRFWDSLSNGESAIEPMREDWADPLHLAGVCRVQNFLPPAETENLDRQIQFGVAASHSALKDARLEKCTLGELGGVYLSSSKGGMETLSQELAQNNREVSPRFFPNFCSSSPASAVALSLGFKGPSLNFVSACASGAHSIMMATRLIQSHPEFVVLAGSTEASLTPFILSGFAKMGVLAKQNGHFDKEVFSPFDVSRNGFVAGEGSAVVVLESLEGAKERGAPIYAEVSGCASVSDATHMIRFDPKGDSIQRAIKLTSNPRNLKEIGYINLHGTATKENDLMETRAIKQIWNKQNAPPMSATKPATGHLLGASGAMEAVITILALKNQFIPPTLNLRNPEPECDLDYTPITGRQRDFSSAISLSYGFGGHVAALAFKIPGIMN